jgi:hypothetical protein
VRRNGSSGKEQVENKSGHIRLKKERSMRREVRKDEGRMKLGG